MTFTATSSAPAGSMDCLAFCPSSSSPSRRVRLRPLTV